MKTIIEVTYEAGLLRPSEALDLPEGTALRLIVLPAETSADQARELADEIYNGFPRRQLRDIEQIAIMSRGLADGGMIDRAE